jgi:ParB-like chromosome segregation protein Spo0J
MNAEPNAARLAVRWQPVDALKADPNNARAHSDRQVERIADSIAAFGFNVPVLVDGEGGVLAGHGRVLAARRLGLKEAPTIVIDHLDEARRRAFMIADNRLAELASWDGVRLGLELDALRKLNPDFALRATGFELREIDLRIGSAGAAGADEGRGGEAAAANHPALSSGASRRRLPPAGEGRRPVARAGDVWRFGPHRLACGEAPDAALIALDGAIQRWQALAGEDARLDPTGETFARTARARRRAAKKKDGAPAR